MRLIGHLREETAARRFGDYLYVQGIQNELDHEAENGWGIWILDEDKLESARGLLAEFTKNPNEPKYVVEGKQAAAKRAEEQKDRKEYEKRIQGRRHLFRPLTPYGFGPLTFALITACVLVFVMSQYGKKTEAIMKLFIADWDLNTFEFNPMLAEVRAGEIWRLISPMLIHFTIVHILFNMLWLRDLGSMVEGRQSSLHLLLLVVIIAAVSNVAQFYVGRSPVFGGMSGVVYGLLGYIWMRGKFDPGSGLFLHPTTVSMMIFWFFVCLFKLIPGLHVANTAHAAGLLAGMAWGFISSLRYR